MKKSLIILTLLLSVSACSNNTSSSSSINSSSSTITDSSTKQEYSNVRFDLNYDTQDDTYINLIVFNGQELKEPKEPNRKDYVFNGWYLEEECINRFIDFNKEIDNDLVLYASWSSYEELNDYEKIDRFINKLKEYTGKVGKTTVVAEGIERYYSPSEEIFPTYQRIEYNRYKDITTIDYYGDDDVKYAEKQFLYEDDYFYGLYKDIENNGIYNELTKAPFSEEKIDLTLNIDFVNLFGSLLNALSSQIKNGTSVDEIDYTFTLNYTYLDPSQLNYSFNVNYYTYFESAEVGSVEEIYMMEYGITFINGMITKSKVIQQYMLGIQGEVQYAIEDNIEATYELVDEYQEFNGERFNPLDFD